MTPSKPRPVREITSDRLCRCTAFCIESTKDTGRMCWLDAKRNGVRILPSRRKAK